MSHFFRHRLPLVLLALFCEAGSAREVVLIDDNWRFQIEAGQQLPEKLQANERDFADDEWRVVNLPHDWSIEGSTAADAPCQGDGGYFPTGIGWYRRELIADPAWRGQRVFLDFEGVATTAEVWINGQLLGKHHYAYTPFRFDITDHLKFDAPNVIAVRVDNSQQPNSRWYTGSGIYRHVWLTVTNAVHLAHNGVKITTPDVSTSEANVEIDATMINQSAGSRDVQLEIEILDPQGSNVGQATARVPIAAGAQATSEHTIKITNPQLWSPDSPSLYQAVLRVIASESVVDEVSVNFGVRTISLLAQKGLFLNGQPVELFGGCVHHDNGPLGAAAFDSAEERRVKLMKEAGFNAIRTSHNPPSTAFLNACDRLGMLVIDEAFDGWAAPKKEFDYSIVFADEWRNDLQAMIDRDHNHPSVIMWSIGNEVYERGDASGIQLAGELAAHTRQIDPTRPVTIALNGLERNEDWPQLDPLFANLDVAGYNYELYRHGADHARVPERMIMCTESFPLAVFEGWASSVDNPYVIGDFVWTGIDYLGEAGIGRVYSPSETKREHWEGAHFPWHGGTCGDLDITGHRKPLSHYRQIVWDRGEKLHMTVQIPSPDDKPWQLSRWALQPTLASWTWPEQAGKPMTVEVYSRYPAVRLFLNGELLGEKPTTREQEFRAEFAVPYSPGTLRAVGIENGQEVETYEIQTAGPAAAIQLRPDRERIQADGQDLSFIDVEIVDAAGILRPDTEQSVKYTIDGPGEIIAVGSGDLSSLKSYQANPRHVYQGRSLVVVRSSDEAGIITMTAQPEGLPAASVKIETQKPVNQD